MTTDQHFLCSSSVSVPPRWREAFAHGQVHATQDVTAPVAAAWTGVLWLSSDDPDWQHHLKKSKQYNARLPVVVLSGTPDPREGLLALAAGASGYTHAYALAELLRELALVVQHGGLWVGPELLQRLVGSTATALAKLPNPSPSLAPSPWAALSAREAQVARAVTAGRSNKEIADSLFISERTVKAHLGAIFEKLAVRDRLQLVVRLAAGADPDATPAR